MSRSFGGLNENDRLFDIRESSNVRVLGNTTVPRFSFQVAVAKADALDEISLGSTNLLSIGNRPSFKTNSGASMRLVAAGGSNNGDNPLLPRSIRCRNVGVPAARPVFSILGVVTECSLSTNDEPRLIKFCV